MGKMQRTKGQTGEREVCALIRDLTGWNAQRRVRQHDGDSDVLGVDGWAIEVKRHKAAPRGDIAAWWAQASAQASGGDIPVLFYRADRDQWRAVWPIAMHLVQQHAQQWRGYEWTVDGSVQAWAAAAREIVGGVG